MLQLVLRCHKRLIRRAVRLLQKGVRAHLAWYRRNLDVLIDAIHRVAWRFVGCLRRMVCGVVCAHAFSPLSP